ncbi:MAG: calcium-translocating P-type ATPase, PMCA-type [Clostridia bacterium]|nr:calcium-translocating P-type ATPase, PMCA-type [Clostridia bacterium]
MRGLDEKQVLQSRKEHGSNEIAAGRRRGFFGLFLEGFSDPIIKILLAALVLNLILNIGQADFFEAIGIAAAILIATFVSALSEYGSEKAFDKMSAESAKRKCRVARSGVMTEIPESEIVVGDIIYLQAGERIPADGRMVEGSIFADQSPLNGESREKQKYPSDDGGKADFSSSSRVFRGCVVTGGEGVMIAEAVGERTFWGGMAAGMREESCESPLRTRLTGLAANLGKAGYIAAATVVASDLVCLFAFGGGSFDARTILSHIIHALTLGITVVVVAVPEGLPMMITVVLSSNMMKMKRDNVMVRKLVGIETAGSMNILFTDKTGTLTKGKLKTVGYISPDGVKYRSLSSLDSPLLPLIEDSLVLNNSASFAYTGRSRSISGGNSTDRALLAFAGEKAAKTRKDIRILAKEPFDSAKKYSSVTVGKGKGKTVYIKGAPELIIDMCDCRYTSDGRAIPFADKGRVGSILADTAGKASRVIAFAVSADTECGGEYAFLGLAEIRDGLRRETKSAVRRITDGGIQVVMMTGDGKDTAAAVARECGIAGEGGDGIYTSFDIAGMSDEELSENIRSIRVVARATPGDKTRLVKAAQNAGLVAGMTGDGVNDAPALKCADVGFAMGSGTDVAKEAGDIVILDDDIGSIAKAVLYGRTIFHSIRKFVIFQLTMNFCAVGVSVIAPLIGVDNPITVIQMLWINMIMDTLAALAFAGEAPLERYMTEPPKRRNEPVLDRRSAGRVVCMGLFTVALCIAFLKLPVFAYMFSRTKGLFMTAFFTLFVLTGLFNCFNARTTRINLLASLGVNPTFVLIIFLVVATQLALIYFGGPLFRCVPMTSGELKTVAFLSATVIPADIIRKLFLKHRKKSE